MTSRAATAAASRLAMATAYASRRADRLWQAWCAFWFESPAEERVRVFRFTLGALLFALYAIRSLDLRLYYSESGLMPLSAVADAVPMDYRKSLFFLFPGDAALWLGDIALLGALAALAFGLWPRLAALAALLLNVSFIHRDMAPTYGVDMIATFFLFYLCLAGSRSSALLSMACRLVQLQVCIIYGYAGLDKVKGPLWWSGEALWGVVSNVQIARWDFSWLSHFPLLLVLATFTTLMWEIYFPAIVWIRPIRKFVLAFGVLLHVCIAVTVNIPFFALLMILSYITFLDEGEARALGRWLRLDRLGVR